MHSEFQRDRLKKEDLVMKQTIQLSEAISGSYSLMLTLLDGRAIRLQVSTGNCISHDSWLRAEGLGLPSSDSTRGDLLIHFSVSFPESIDPSQAATLRDALFMQCEETLSDEKAIMIPYKSDHLTYMEESEEDECSVDSFSD